MKCVSEQLDASDNHLVIFRGIVGSLAGERLENEIMVRRKIGLVVMRHLA